MAKNPDKSGQRRPMRFMTRRKGAGYGVADVSRHAAFTKQYVAAFTPSAVLSSSTSPSTVTRQPMNWPSPCARRSGLTEGMVVSRVRVHGRLTCPPVRCGNPSRSV